MKKLVCFIFCIFLMTGCGKKLECFIVEQTEDYSISENIVLTFDKNGSQIKKGVYDLSLTIKDEYIDYLDDFENSIIDQYDDLEDINVKIKTDKEDLTLKMNLKYDASKYDIKSKEKLLDKSLFMYGSFEQVKIEFEKDGYTCK